MGGKNTFSGGRYIYFYHVLKTNFSEHNKIWGPQERFNGNCPQMPPVSAGLGTTVTRKSSIGGLHVYIRGLDILKIIFNSQHEQHLQIVQINYKYFPANTHNRHVASN